jgi:basic amino acid/polyamine antiporter, APA family
MEATRQLNRSLGLSMVIVVVITNILGSGVYKKVAPMAAVLHSPGWIMVCWILGGIISLFGALSYAEVAGLLADTGGDYAYYKKIYGRFFSFLFGWSIFTVIQTAAISSLAYLFAHSLANILQLPETFTGLKDLNLFGIFYPFQDISVKLVAIALIILLTLFNSLGLKTGSRFSTAMLALILVGILTIVVAGATSGHADYSRILDFKGDPNAPVTFGAVFTAMLATFWAYQGWASVGFVGGEIKDANKIIPRGITIGVFVVITLYLLANSTYLALLGIPELEQVDKSQSSIAAVEAIRTFGGSKGALLISLLILVTTLSSTHATILSSCRIIYAMGREGLFFKPASKLNKHNVPANAMVYQCIWGIILVLSGSFDQLTDMCIFAVYFFYGSTALGVFVLRRKMPDAPRPYKVWLYPIVPAVVVIFSAVLFVNTFSARPREAAIGLFLMLTSIPMYFLFNRMYKGSEQSAVSSQQ